MKNKIIVGVGHQREEEIEKVKDIITRYDPSTIGIELPEDYLKKEKYGIKTFLFGDIAIYARNKNIHIIPLENSKIWNYHQSIEIAKAVKKGRIKEDKVKIKLDYFKEIVDPFSSPEQLYKIELLSDRYKKALEIIRNNKTLEDIIKLWEKSNRRREEYMLEKINKEKPDMVIIGFRHSEKIRSILKEYKYIKAY